MAALSYNGIRIPTAGLHGPHEVTGKMMSAGKLICFPTKPQWSRAAQSEWDPLDPDLLHHVGACTALSFWANPFFSTHEPVGLHARRFACHRTDGIWPFLGGRGVKRPRYEGRFAPCIPHMGFFLALKSFDLTTFRLILIGRALLRGFLCFIGGVTTTCIAVQVETSFMPIASLDVLVLARTTIPVIHFYI